MKKLLFLLTTISILAFAQSCQIGKTITVRDTVKNVGTTTADYYQGYDEVRGEFKLKDINHTVLINKGKPDMEITIIPAPDKHDAGYHIIKPAILSGKLDMDTQTNGEFKVKLSQLKLIEIPQRGN